MKTLIVSSMGALLLVSGGLSGGDVLHADSTNTADLQKETGFAKIQDQGAVSQDISNLPEFESIQSHIDVSQWDVRVLEDNPYKRVIIFSDEKGIPQYKSIFVKETSRHKLIDFHNGLLVNKVLKNTAGNGDVNVDNETNNSEQEEEEKSDEDGEVDDFAEFDLVEEHTDLDDEQWNVVEDNDHKRVMTGINNDGEEQFKSIFVKDTNILKIIDFKGGLLYNDILTDEEDDKDDEAEQDEEETEVDDLTEYDILEELTDADEDQMKIVEDNPYKRVIMVSSENGKEQVKSIYVKETKRLKVIDFNSGLLFNEIIK